MNRKQREQKLYDLFENNKKTEIKEKKNVWKEVQKQFKREKKNRYKQRVKDNKSERRRQRIDRRHFFLNEREK